MRDETANLYRFEHGEMAGQLPANSWPGNPIVYFSRDHNGEIFELCAKCANEIEADAENDETVFGADANYENAQLYCANCSERIESAYCENETILFDTLADSMAWLNAWGNPCNAPVIETKEVDGKWIVSIQY